MIKEVSSSKNGISPLFKDTLKWKNQAKNMQEDGIRIVSFDKAFEEAGLNMFSLLESILQNGQLELPETVLCDFLSFKEMFLKLIAKGYC